MTTARRRRGGGGGGEEEEEEEAVEEEAEEEAEARTLRAHVPGANLKRGSEAVRPHSPPPGARS